MRSAVIATFVFGLMLASWMAVGPSVAGGPAVYTIISGTSMNPLLHRGDLAILRVGRDAQVGEVFGYRGVRGHAVLHRVIAESPAGYTLKGDNNSWIDSTQPTNDELIGELWFHIPGGGRVLEWVRTPLHAAAIAGGVIAMASLPGSPSSSAALRRVSHRLPSVPRRRDSWMLAAAGPRGDTLIGVLGGIVVLAAALGAVMWLVVPSSREVTTSLPYSQRAQFAYTAEAVIPTVSAIPLPGTSIEQPEVPIATLLANPTVRDLVMVPVKTGEPIFVNINPTLDMTVNYTFSSALDHAVSGTIQADVVVGDITGWQRFYPWIPPTPFVGDNASIKANTGDLRAFMNIFPIYEAISGHAPRYYTIALVATVKIDGVVGGHEMHETLDPNLTFRMVPPYEIFVETAATREFEVPGVPLPPGTPDPYVTRRDGSISHVEAIPNSIPILGLSVPVLGLRVGAASTVALALAGCAVLIVLRALAQRRGEDFMIRARYAEEIVAVGHSRDDVNLRHLHLTSMDDLVHLARMHGVPIFMEVTGAGHRYLVVREQWVYTYDVAGTPDWRDLPDAA